MFRRVGDGIESRPTERVAAAQPDHSKPPASDETMASDCLGGVIGARRDEPAGARKPRRKQILIRSYKGECRACGGPRQWLTGGDEGPDRGVH
jgi:hypothetical protein